MAVEERVSRPPLNRNTFRLLTFLAVSVGLLGTLSDLLMLYAPGFATNMFVSGVNVAASRLTTGMILGIVVLPFHILTYYLLYEILRQTHPRAGLLMLILGIYGVVQGTVFHAVAGYTSLIAGVQADSMSVAATVLAPYLSLTYVLFAYLHILLLIGSVVFAVIVLSKETLLPRWTAAVSPGLLTLLLFGVGAAFRPFGDFLFPTALNIAHAAFALIIYGAMSGRLPLPD